MKKFFKGLGLGIKHTGTTVFGMATVAAMAVNQNPAILNVVLSPENAKIGGTVAGFIATVTAIATASAAADASKTSSK